MLRSFSVIARLILIVAAVVMVLVLFPKVNGSSFAGALIFAAIFALLVSLLTFVRGALQNGLVVVATVVLGIAVLEFAAQLMQPRIAETAGGLWRSDLVLGTGPNSGVFHVEKKVDGKVIYNATYTIDPRHLRATKSAASGPTIAFLGDSLMFGEGLNDADTLPQLFADRFPALHVVNLAYSGYSPAQALRELQVGLYDQELAATRLFVLLTGAFHVERTSCGPFWVAYAPKYRMVDGELVDEGPCASGLWLKADLFIKQLGIYRTFVEKYLDRPTGSQIEDYLNIVAAVTKIAHDKYHAPLIVLYSIEPHYLDGTGWTDQRVEARMRAAGAQVVTTEVAAKPGDVLTIPGDGHPTALANRLLARKLVDHIEATTPSILQIAPAGSTADRDR